MYPSTVVPPKSRSAWCNKEVTMILFAGTWSLLDRRSCLTKESFCVVCNIADSLSCSRESEAAIGNCEGNKC